MSNKKGQICPVKYCNSVNLHDNTWAAGDEDLTEIVSIMKRECTKSPLIKGTYILATDDRVIFIGGINSSDIHGNKVDAYTTYEIGSLTKAFTATAVLQLCERGNASLAGFPVKCCMTSGFQADCHTVVPASHTCP